jgi:hypothetical protein
VKKYFLNFGMERDRPTPDFVENEEKVKNQLTQFYTRVSQFWRIEDYQAVLDWKKEF